MFGGMKKKIISVFKVVYCFYVDVMYLLIINVNVIFFM